MTALYAKSDLLDRLGKRKRTTSVEMSTTLPGIAAPHAQLAQPAQLAPPANVAADVVTFRNLADFAPPMLQMN